MGSLVAQSRRFAPFPRVAHARHTLFRAVFVTARIARGTRVVPRVEPRVETRMTPRVAKFPNPRVDTFPCQLREEYG